MIAVVDAGGLGLPDRDYYVKTDAKSVETRERYVAHVAKMFELLGEPHAAAKANAATVMRIETALAKASLTQVEQRDPYKIYHRQTLAVAAEARARLRLERVLQGGGARIRSRGSTSTEPAFFKELNARLAKESLDGSEDLSALGARSMRRAPILSSPFVNENFAFYRKYLRGVEQRPAALEEVRGAGGSRARRSARAGVRRARLPGGDEGEDGHDDAPDRRGHEGSASSSSTG